MMKMTESSPRVLKTVREKEKPNRQCLSVHYTTVLCDQEVMCISVMHHTDKSSHNYHIQKFILFDNRLTLVRKGSSMEKQKIDNCKSLGQADTTG